MIAAATSHEASPPRRWTPKAAFLLVLALGVALEACASRPKAPPPTALRGGPEATPQAALPPRGLEPGSGALAPGSQEDLAATVGDRVFFALDSEALDDEARSSLRRQAGWLAAHPQVRARLAGNADERGTPEYNLALGARRAAAARQYLISQGVDARRLETISYGKERPLDPRSDEAGWARNRNAQTVVIGVEER